MSRFNMLLILCVSGLSQMACSSGSSKEINYRDNEVTPTLEIPPDLISRSTGKNLSVPGSKVGMPENRGRFVETGNLNVGAKTLPVFDNIQIQGQGDFHWLSVMAPVENVYPLIQQFWAEQGFSLVVDEPATGSMETQWLDLKTGADSFFGSMVSPLTGVESRDQFSTRFERNSETNSTRLYLSHRMQQVSTDSEEHPVNNSYPVEGWQFAPSDPSKEYEMLARMMIFLGMQDNEVRREFEQIGLFAARAKIENDDDGQAGYLLVNQGFVQTWNRLRHQMDRLHVAVAEIRQEQNSGLMELNESDLLRHASRLVEVEQSAKLVLALRSNSALNTTRIDVLNEAGLVDHSAQSRQILDFLLQHLK